MLKRLIVATALVTTPIILALLVSSPLSAQSGDAVVLTGRVSWRAAWRAWS